MIIKDLPPGTKLMWDAPLPFPGYRNSNSTQKDRIVYPMIITNRIPKIPELGKHLKSSSSGNWMGFENENLRLPTEEELNTLKWPDIEM